MSDIQEESKKNDQNTKIDKINKQLEILKARKNKLIAIENTKNRKLLVKQKILIGGYMLNELNKKPLKDKIDFLHKVKNTIDDTRKSDHFAIDYLIQNSEV